MQFIVKYLPIVGICCLFVITGCATQGPYVPVSEAPTVEDQNAAVLYDSGLQSWIAVDRINGIRIPDDRLQIFANLRNQKNQDITVQVQTVFKDNQGFSIGDDTAWQTLIFNANESRTYETTSMNNKAYQYTVRIRHAQ